MCTFNKDARRLECFFKIEILLKKCSPHELSISRHKKKKDCHLNELLFSQRSHGRPKFIMNIVFKKKNKNSACEVLPWKYNSQLLSTIGVCTATQMVKEKC